MVVSLALMFVDQREHHLEGIRSTLSVALSPLSFLVNLPRSVSDWAAESLASRSELQQTNQRLRKDNLLLQAKQQKMDALEAENMRLRNLLDSSFKIGDRVLIAELVAVDLDPYRQQVLINKGTSSGVYEGQPVLDANAVMGQVTHVNPLTATVLLITDARHALPVQVNRNGLRTVALGTGRINVLELPHLPNNADISVGDLLITSGLGGHFPPGYPVAEVTSVVREPGQPFAAVEARPMAHLDRTREALLVWTLDTRPAIPTAADAADDAENGQSEESAPDSEAGAQP